ncbi:MAG: hypothetical protein ACM3PY_20050, partial [Omnitrophica WOR_2 bacterium]
LLKTCLVASALILVGQPGISGKSPYQLIYTAEGTAEDVDTELSQARTVLQKDGAREIFQVEQPSGSEAWAAWLHAATDLLTRNPSSGFLARLGVPPKLIPVLLSKNTVHLEGFIADLASGFLYIQDMRDIQTFKEQALLHAGYLLVLSGPNQPEGQKVISGDEQWSYRPPAMDLMTALKRQWDRSGLFNPEAFVIE